jgi:hypothetical protein
MFQIIAVALAVVAAPRPLGPTRLGAISVFDAPAAVDGSRCAVISKRRVGEELELGYCCDSCHHPYLLTNDDFKVSFVSADLATSASKAAFLDLNDNGSGELIATQSTSVVAVSVLKELEQLITFPCGRCITVDECTENGRLELWHHQCFF